MGLFKSKAEKELDAMILRLEMNLSNNYKDNAQENFKDLDATFQSMQTEGKLKGSALNKYGKIVEEYRQRVTGYSHKDQKPFWT